MLEARDGQESGEKRSGTTRVKLLMWLGRTLIAVSVVGFICGFVAFQVARVQSPDMLWKLAAVGLPLVLLVMVGGVTCYKLGKQLGTMSAQAMLDQDLRAPVVYLRSFQDDAVAAVGSDYPGRGALWTFVSAIATEEEQLAQVMKDFGPFIAIGKPGEKLPELGAARMYLEDSEWRDKVRELMSRANLVVLRAGTTDGLWWEVETAAKIVSPEKILFLLPYEREQYDAFRLKAEKYLPCRLPDYLTGKKKITAGSIRGILYFEPDWRPHFLELKGFDRAEFTKPWVRTFKTTLEPVYGQLHVEWRKPRSNLYWVVPLVVLSPVLAFGALYLVLKLAELFIH